MKNELTPLTIGDILVRQDEEGRYCLNDLHKAAGGAAKHKPGNWLQTQQTKDLIAEMEKAGIPAIQSKQGLGTFAHMEMVYDYAMWISAAFKVKVIRGYDAAMRQLIDQANNQTEALKQAAVAGNPVWKAIHRYKTVCRLTQREIAKLMGLDPSTVRRHVREMERCGVLTPPANLAACRALAVNLEGGAA
jgi:hypothetical protein